MLILLWSVPAFAALLAALRSVQGEPGIDDKLRRRLFGASPNFSVSPLVILEFLLLAVVFFGLGLFEALVLVNFGAFWIVTAPLITGIAAMALAAHCLRHAKPPARKYRTPARFKSMAKRLFGLLSDLPARLHEKN